MNKVKTWQFELNQPQKAANNVHIGQRVIGSIEETNAPSEPQKLWVSLSANHRPIGFPPPDIETDIILTVGPNNPVILKGQILSVESDEIIIELSFFK